VRNKGRILIVENDIDISKMLRIYFDSQGYEALVTNRYDAAWIFVAQDYPELFF
jgi:DNA-binding response OmpR family regulator